MKLPRRKSLQRLAYSVALMILCNVAGAAMVTKTVDKYPLTDFSKPLVVQAQAPVITINLLTNPSTGYQWYLLQYDDKILEPISYQYLPSARNKVIGAAGISSWQFQLKKTAFQVPRVSPIEFEYRRSWEAVSGNRQTMTVVTVPAAPVH